MATCIENELSSVSSPNRQHSVEHSTIVTTPKPFQHTTPSKYSAWTLNPAYYTNMAYCITLASKNFFGAKNFEEKLLAVFEILRCRGCCPGCINETEWDGRQADVTHMWHRRSNDFDTTKWAENETPFLLTVCVTYVCLKNTKKRHLCS